MPDLADQVAVVTGGTKGIGRAIAEALHGAGARVVVGARTESDVRAAERDLGDGALGVVCDVRVQEDCERLMAEAKNTFGRLDILVNNAGVGVFGEVESLEPEDWRTAIETNLNGPYYCAHAALPHLKEGGDAWIINIGSLAGKNAFPRGAAYNASKFGLIGFSEALMQEVRHDGVRVTTIMPGSVATGFGHPNPGSDDWKVHPDDIARIVLDLLEFPYRALPSRIEVRPSRPPKK
ncbi:MAG TPA: SDR family oxidoreductase [Longimicrobiales bacterium]|nr:SDR family oxidoreductase [Longimicrobiales bacterium]